MLQLQMHLLEFLYQVTSADNVKHSISMHQISFKLISLVKFIFKVPLEIQSIPNFKVTGILQATRPPYLTSKTGYNQHKLCVLLGCIR